MKKQKNVHIILKKVFFYDNMCYRGENDEKTFKEGYDAYNSFNYVY